MTVSDSDLYFFCQATVYNPYDPDFCLRIVYNPYVLDFCSGIVYNPYDLDSCLVIACSPGDLDFCSWIVCNPYVLGFCSEIVYNVIVSGNRDGRPRNGALVSTSVDLLVFRNHVGIARVSLTFDPQNTADSCRVGIAHQEVIHSSEHGHALDRYSSADLCRGNYL